MNCCTMLVACVLGVMMFYRGTANERHHVRACTITHIDVCANTACLSIPSLFRPGDTVVIHQVASRDVSNVGAFDINIIDTMIGAIARFRYAMRTSFDIDGKLQLVRAVNVRRIDTSNSITTVPWNGQYGGVIAIVSTDTVYIDGVVAANGIGFRGGISSNNSRDTALTEPPTIDNGTLITFNGYPRNGGGYGGSLLTPGGRGGAPTNAYKLTRSISWPAAATITERDVTQPRLYLGSGGGSGHQNDLRGGKGGNGGGAILICAPHVVATTRATLDASGSDGDEAMYDGAGGGGSGGTILLATQSLHGGIVCDVSGGVGGSTRGSIYRYGPGGGGAGGVVTVTDSTVQPFIRVQRGGGAGGGSHVDTSDDTTPFGADPGADGMVRTVPFDWTSSRTSAPVVTLVVRDTTIEGTSFLKCWASTGTVIGWRIDSLPGSTANILLLPRDSVRCCIEADVDVGGCTTRIAYTLPLEPRIGNEIRVSLDRIRGTIGDTVSIFLRIERRSGQSSIQGTAYIRLRQTVLMPLEFPQRSATTYARVGIPFTLTSSTRSTFRRIEAIALLGDSAQIQLSIDSVSISPRSTTVVREHGRFTLDDVCLDRGYRLFDPSYSDIIRGRSITLLADAGIVTDLRGRVLCRLLRNDRDGLLTGSIPDDHRGICYIVVTRGSHMQTYAVMVEP